MSEYVKRNGIKRVVVFSPPRFQTTYDGNVEMYTWDDAIMYRVFYPLLETVDGSTLIICDEMLRKRNRSELTYNCLHHYQNQTPHRITFEYFPFIDDVRDFMILLDFEKPNKYKGQSFDPRMLADEDVLCVRHTITPSPVAASLPEGALEAYVREKEKLFAQLGSKDPDTIPRALHVWCGKYKRAVMDGEHRYVARNARYNLPNVATYSEVSSPGEYVVVDFPHERLVLNDFLKLTGMERVPYITTGLPVDCYYARELASWAQRLEVFYASASVYQ